MLFLFACAYISTDLETQRIDPDGDGFSWLEDCDSENELTSMNIWYEDVDGDGYGNPEVLREQCEAPAGNWVERGNDCDDSNEFVNIHALEVCDEIDNDCDGFIDNEDDSLSFVSQYIFLLDMDEDGYPQFESEVQSCTPPANVWKSESGEAIVILDTEQVEITYDCDDNNAEIYPNKAVYEAEGLCSGDTDNDGYAPREQGGQDCDDNNELISPASPEVCDEFDNNCDGRTNEGIEDQATHFLDSDGDGYGNTDVFLCTESEGYVIFQGDCDDSNSSVAPDMPELCDDIDNDCDGDIDEDISTEYFVDSDGDGFGNANDSLLSCNGIPVGYIDNSGDCNDQDAESYPNALEYCHDGLDNDCDEEVDENTAINVTIFYLDEDGDGFGGETTITQCNPPDFSYAFVGGDCDDSSSSISPLAQEIALDGIDQNCDGLEICYEDLDGDGYGSMVTVLDENLSCLGSGVSVVNTDCDDTSENRFPLFSEICDGVDNDCDGQIDEEISSLYYLDDDNDGFGDVNQTTSGCDGIPDGYVENSEDCDDSNIEIAPNADEICDYMDNNCDELIDDSTSVDISIYYLDEDEDGFGDENVVFTTCFLPNGYVENSEDCDDTNTDIRPDVEEVWYDGIDQNCDNTNDFDQDGDGYEALEYGGTDCNDLDTSIRPDAEEIWYDGIDQNCDNANDFDQDGDGFEVISYTQGNQNITHGGSDCDDTQSDLNECGLYLFSSHTFSTCGLTGKDGPEKNDCENIYETQNNWHQDEDLFKIREGLQNWKVPTTGTYNLSVRGASGGSSISSMAPSYGAMIQAELDLVEGDVLIFVVGQRGLSDINEGNANGGGGGSFVFLDQGNNVRQTDLTSAILLVAAGGGGGAPYVGANTDSQCSVTDGNAQLGTSGASRTCTYMYWNIPVTGTALGGENGSGGESFNVSTFSKDASGGGGAGFLDVGQDNTANGGCSTTRGGKSANGEFRGGNSSCDAEGGFGGGGAGNRASGGGGGGYSGGASMGKYGNTIFFYDYGGGGGSYVDSFITTSTIDLATVIGEGEIAITLVSQ